MATSVSNLGEQLHALIRRNRVLAHALSSDEPSSGVERLATQKYFTFHNEGEYLVVSDEDMHFLCSIGTIRSIKDMVYRLELTEQAKGSLKLLLAEYVHE